MSAPGRIARWLARIELAEQVLLGLLVGAMVVLAALQILLRNAWGRGITWADPFLGSAMLWITLLGALAATGRRKHIAIDLVSNFVPAGARRVFQIITDLAAAVVCGFLAAAAVRYVGFQREMGDEAFAGIRQWVVLLILPAGFGLMSLRFFAQGVWACFAGPQLAEAAEARSGS
jgi:C4-dicarboxylate transporter DctQ subunit